MRTSEQIADLAAALALAVAEFGRVTRDAANPHLRTRYASLASAIEATAQALAAHGLAVVSGVESREGGLVLRARLIHGSGQWIEAECPVLVTSEGRQPPMQMLGSAITYARRYAVMALLGLAPVDEDDDGESQRPSQRPAPRPSQPADASPPRPGMSAAAGRAMLADAGLDPHVVRAYVVRADRGDIEDDAYDPAQRRATVEAVLSPEGRAALAEWAAAPADKRRATWGEMVTVLDAYGVPVAAYTAWRHAQGREPLPEDDTTPAAAFHRGGALHKLERGEVSQVLAWMDDQLRGGR